MSVTLTGKLSGLATGGAVSKTSDGAYVITDTVYIGSGGATIDVSLTCTRIECDGNQAGINAGNPLIVNLGKAKSAAGDVTPIEITLLSQSSWSYSTDGLATRGHVEIKMHYATVSFTGGNSGFMTWGGSQSQANVNFSATDSYVIAWTNANKTAIGYTTQQFPAGGGVIDGLHFVGGNGAYWSKTPISTKNLDNTFNPTSSIGFAVASSTGVVTLNATSSSWFRAQQAPTILDLIDCRLNNSQGGLKLTANGASSRINLYKTISVNMVGCGVAKVSAWNNSLANLLNEETTADVLSPTNTIKINHYRYGGSSSSRARWKVIAGNGAELFVSYTDLRIFRYGIRPVLVRHTFDVSSEDNLLPITITGLAVPDGGVTLDKTAAMALSQIDTSSQLYDMIIAHIDNNHGSFLPTYTFPERLGGVADFGSDNLSLGNAFASTPSYSAGTWTVKCGTTLGGKITSTGVVTLNGEITLTNMTINGDLHINTGANSTLTFDGVIVTGTVFNNDASHTLTINAGFGTSIVADDAGTGNGQVEVLQAPVTLEVTSLVSGSFVKVTKVSNGDLLFKGAEVSGTTIFDITYIGEVEIEARKSSSAPYYKPYVTRATLTGTSVSIPALQQLD